VVVNPSNLGAAAAANRGIEIASADIIARMDADDVAEPTHVARLVAALEDDPQLGLVGSSVTCIDETGQPHSVQRMPETDIEIRWTMLFHNPFYHPAVAFRRSCFEAAGRYIAEELVSHDHYLWFHMLPFCRMRNIAEPLTRYRLNPRGLTATHSQNNPRNRTHRIRETLWARLGLTYDLYDNAVASDLTQFLRGYDIAVIDRRAAAYGTILTSLRVFLAAPRPLAQPGDTESARKLAHTIVARVLANPPADLREMLMICGLCWPLDRRAAIRAMVGRLTDELKARWQVARTWLSRIRAN
jgi:glycosyltransferase involved in cell wall biosynthesis